MMGAIPGYLSPGDAVQPGHALIAFARYLHIDLGLLAGTALEYVVHVVTAHTARGLPSPARHPDWTLIRSRLEKLAADSPNQALCIGVSMVRNMLRGPVDRDFIEVTIAFFFLGARPIEMLGDDGYSMVRNTPVTDPLFDRRRTAWDNASWHRADGGCVHAEHPSVAYMLVGLKRKGDPHNVQKLPVYKTGAPGLCFVGIITARWRRLGRPARGPIFGTRGNGAFFRQASYRAWLHQQEFRCRAGRLVPYGFRRGVATSLDRMGLAVPLQLQFLAHKPAGETSKTHVRYVDPDPTAFQGVAAAMLTVKLVTMR